MKVPVICDPDPVWNRLEINDTRTKLYMYDSKFIPGSEHYDKIENLIPARLDEKLLKKLEYDNSCQYSSLLNSYKGATVPFRS